ncbi:MAG: thiamine pyrophosphate-dependent dehydrogenase E1 component subunit alpha [SAR202 cluster bacterium]|nr:thiamine pyrophosphate-dependent dehydrogenase E1 component subunit alpha [SAR202 cluster bacterium]|tara:strand:+ start:214 stop:1239 length:1026 start_codon:yes stop_codon:yes gene_type:complete
MPNHADKTSQLPGQLSGERLVDLYRTMVLSRHLDERVWLLNRQGKAAIAASAQGHEAAQVACIEATDPVRDHYLIYYRQFTAMIALGTEPEEMLRGFLARESDPMNAARQFPLHGAHPRVDLFNFSNVIATQLPQAAGVALADKINGSDAVTLVFFGDGASSQGDAHEAMNFAGVHKLPLIFFCENNRYAISVPIEKQMGIENVASRAASYGFPGVQVDGTDVTAVHEATLAAVERARSGQGPTLIEACVERLLPHTTDDDHTRYRSEDDIKTMSTRDPLRSMSDLLKRRGLLTDLEDQKIHKEAKKRVNLATDVVEAEPYPSVETMFNHISEGPAHGEGS